jgi:hypothetical protein
MLKQVSRAAMFRGDAPAGIALDRPGLLVGRRVYMEALSAAAAQDVRRKYCGNSLGRTEDMARAEGIERLTFCSNVCK